MAEPENGAEKDEAPMARAAHREVPWWSVAVFAFAFVARLAFAVAVDPAPTDVHQYKTYYWNGLRIAGHARPLEYVLRSDGWHTWDAPIMTVAPLYHLMLGAFFHLFGPGLLGLRVFQAALGAAAAVAVASLGRRLAGPHGAWAGVAYAAHWPALEMTSWTLTENLHTPLLVVAFAVLAAGTAGAAGERSRGLLGGFLLGLSALARSVSSAFAPLLLLWRLTAAGVSRPALRRGLLPTLFVAAGCLLALLPWAARNRLLLGKNVVIETVGFFNLWDDNARGLDSKDRYVRQFEALLAQEDPGDFARMATEFAWRNIVRNPDGFFAKVDGNFWHFVRPERLYNFLSKEAAYSDGPWQNALSLILDDALLMLALPFFAAFVLGGAPSPTRRLLVSWSVYYLTITLIAFHAEVRYRSALTPFLLAGAAGGFVSVMRPSPRRRPLVWAGLLAGAALVVTVTRTELRGASKALASYRAFQPAVVAVQRGEPASAMRIAEAAAGLDPGAARPWLRCGSLMAVHDHTAEAMAAYLRALQATDGQSWTAVVALPRLLLDAGRPDEASRAVDSANQLSYKADPSALLEIAWRELPPPRTDEILLGGGDYGAVRGFHRPRGIGEAPFGPLASGEKRPPPGPHRWSRGRAWVRLRPTERAKAYDVAITMGSPFPSPTSHPVVDVRVNDSESTRITLGPEIRVYHVEASVREGEPLVVRLDAPTWARVGEPPDQGVRVDALRVTPDKDR